VVPHLGYNPPTGVPSRREAFVDYLKRHIHRDGQFKFTVVNTTQIGRDLFSRLAPTPDALQLMVQAATGALLMAAAGLKDEEGTLALSFQGNGPAGRLNAEANTRGTVRAIVDTLDLVTPREGGLFGEALGEGKLTVSRRTRRHQQVYRSVVSLVAGEMALQLANFLLQSDQVRSGILLGAELDPDRGVAGAGGVLIQAMPEADPNLIVILEDRLANLPPMGQLFRSEDAHSQVGELLFDGIPVKWLETTEVAYRCQCSRARIYQTVVSLPESEIAEMAGEGTPIDLSCHYCNETYTLTPADLAQILDQKRARTD